MKDAALRHIYRPVRGAILDVGCGHGTLLATLAGENPALRLAGIDPDPEMMRVAKLELWGHRLRGMVAMRNGGQGRGICSGRVRRGLRCRQCAVIGIENEAGDGIAQIISRIDKPAERRIDDDRHRLGIRGVAEVELHRRGSAGGREQYCMPKPSNRAQLER